ncbi:hypothetical protein VM1G_05448 [Cytospora mali]|uniref:Uncharacterized protein n=1 Tax=Cytospora mali TaxID=578113 RepID=A0A194W0M5_CYTMA|nr:hypothetical protein VM1G_05448 [Valsa mali]
MSGVTLEDLRRLKNSCNEPIKVLPSQKPLPNEHRNAWDFIVQEILPVVKDAPAKSVMEDPGLSFLKRRPLRRYVELRGNRPVSSLWLSKYCQLLGLLMYLTGDVVVKPCSYCAQGSGIFEKCVVFEAIGERSCATHLHNSHALLCDIQPRPLFSGWSARANMERGRRTQESEE